MEQKDVISNDDIAKINKLLENYTIHKLDNISVCIFNKHFHFAYTIADSVVKEEFFGKYDYFGGLQCNYEKEDYLYKILEGNLIIIAKRILNTYLQ